VPRAAPRRGGVDYITRFNSTRLPSALGYQTPNQCEATIDEQDLMEVA
jgi:hypothetical protein